MKKLPKIKTLKDKLDKVFSQYIRLSSSEDGYCRCFTCGDPHPWKEIDCGHWISRGRLMTRWDENNCRCQCKGCNLFGKITGQAGEPYLFGLKLESENVDVAQLMLNSKIPMKLDREWLSKKIEYYTEKVQKYA